MKAAVVGLGTLCLAVGATPSNAQYGTPSPPPPQMPTVQNPRQEPAAASSPAQILAGADCLIVREPSLGEDLLAAAPYSAQEREAALIVLRRAQRCLRLRGPIAASALVARGAVAEALVERRFAQMPAAREPALVHAAWFRPELATARTDAASLAPSYTLSRCTVERRPDLVRALLATDPATPAEETALQAFNPVWVACVAAGSRLSIDRAAIRALMAEDLYRWAVVQRDGPASPFAAPPASAN